jgi:SAM-dependent methyltransferase
VVERLPAMDLPICEVGSGPRGLAVWTDRKVIGIDPGPDNPHGSDPPPDNFTRLAGEGASIPLADHSVSAAVAVDTFEHIPRDGRAAVVLEMKRVVCDGGRIIVIGPVGPDAARFDARVLERWRARGETENIVHWLSEHQEIGLPSVDELIGYLGTERVTRITFQGVLNVRLWWLMHRALLGDFSRSRGSYLLQSALTPAFSRLARTWGRGPYYRYLVSVDIGPTQT